MAPDFAVIGAGIVGLATADALVERGEEVVVYETGQPGGGQSAGESRLFRHAHDDERLVKLAIESRGLWSEMEERLGEELISGDGVVALGETAVERLKLLEKLDVHARKIDAAEVAERHPLLADYDGDAVLDEAGGSIRTTAAVRLLSERLGERIVPGEVITVRSTGDETVEVRTPTVRSEHARVIVCAGRGTAPLARGAGLELPINHACHMRATFEVKGDPPERVACLQDGAGAWGETGVYAAPQPGNERYAVGLAETMEVRDDGTVVDPAQVRRARRPRRRVRVEGAAGARIPTRSSCSTAGSPTFRGTRTRTRSGSGTACSSPAATTSGRWRRCWAPRSPPRRAARASATSCARTRGSALGFDERLIGALHVQSMAEERPRLRPAGRRLPDLDDRRAAARLLRRRRHLRRARGPRRPRPRDAERRRRRDDRGGRPLPEGGRRRRPRSGPGRREDPVRGAGQLRPRAPVRARGRADPRRAGRGDRRRGRPPRAGPRGPRRRHLRARPRQVGPEAVEALSPARRGDRRASTCSTSSRSRARWSASASRPRRTA